MTSIDTLERNLGTRHEAEAAAMVLDRATQHLTDNRTGAPAASPVGLLASLAGLAGVVGDLQAILLLTDISLQLFPEHATNVRKGGL